MRKIKKYQLGANLNFPNLGQGLYNSTAGYYNPLPYVSQSQKTISNLPSVAGKSTTSNSTNQAISQGVSQIIAQTLGDSLFDENSELGRITGQVFSQGINSTLDTLGNNLLKGQVLTEGLAKNAGTSLAGAGAGIAANYIGKGISGLMGNSKIGKFTGQATATGLGTVGGRIASNLISTGAINGGLSNGLNLIGTATKTGGVGKLLSLRSAAGQINPMGLGMSMIGTGLQAALGPSKEYGGRYGNITQGLDTAYDYISIGANAIPGIGQGVSGIMALNKGLSNLFGSTDGMTKTDAILGSAFMPAPIKWLNMWGSSKTGTFDRQSWQNAEKTTSFMQNAYGDLQSKFDRAREEAGKRYGTFSQGAKRRAQRNLDFANNAYSTILDLANQNRYQNIRAEDMTSINNQRYAQMIQGGWSPTAIGRQGMKILNNATNHNIGMRLLSAAALIDNKQMILCNVDRD